MKKQSKRYYDVRRLVTDYPDARYYVVIGERSNGKTYSSLDRALQQAAESGEEFGYIRRFGEDIRPKNLTNLFNAHLENGRIEELWNGAYNAIEYKSNKFLLTKRMEDGRPDPDTEPLLVGRAFDLNSMEHYKSISFPRITTIIFDEFLSRQGYLPNEFMLFQNALSTIIRDRDNVKIFMLGNTVNKYCPYFAEMGLKHVNEQKQGTVDVYRYGSSGLEVAVEYCESTSKHGGKASDVYFAFDNPQLKMITTGTWEIGIYPHLPCEYKPKDVIQEFFIEFEHELLHGLIIAPPNYHPFVFLHPKTTEIKHDDDYVYTTQPTASRYRMQGLTRQNDKLSQYIKKCISEGRVFYATNETGEVFRNFLLWGQNQRLV